MPNPSKPLRINPRNLLENLRHSLSYIDALPQLTLLGAIVGLATGLVMVIFRLAIDLPLTVFLAGHPENFEALSPLTRGLLIIAGAGVVCALMMVYRRHAEVGVAYVLDRLHNYQGYLSWRNTALQFVGALLCLISGQSVGREGPVVHLGAGAASVIGQKLKLPNNSLQTLIACGVAAAIAASFDTPMAGVIFAMEVLLVEYTVVGFVPVILASVIGAGVSHVVFGQPDFGTSVIRSTTSLIELPLIAAGGLLIAMAAAFFIRIHVLAQKTAAWPLPLRFALAGVLTALLAWPVPEIMGQGYDTLSGAMAGELALTALAIIAVAKLCSSALVTGLGLPGGLIGPTLVTGACIGGVLGSVAQGIDPGFAPLNVYVMLGMAAMMAAVLNAPLAALVAVLELSYEPGIIFPAMLIIVSASVTTRALFKAEGIFVEELKVSGRSVQHHPAHRVLRRAGVLSILDDRFVSAPRHLDYEEAKALLIRTPQWLVVETDNKNLLLQAADLANYLEEAPVEILSLEENIDLLHIPARRRPMTPIHPTATLLEALRAMRVGGTDALYVTRPSTPLTSSIHGIITQEAIDNHYQPRF